ncbi:MAG: hypothetical protein KDA24_04200 [Deltaproteobacteria bacterium]|nr:hypothetical protein [Deltaproteobacteria bacterium]
MSLLPDLGDENGRKAADLVRLQAELLYKRATWSEAAGMVGAAFSFGVLAYLWSDFRGGWDHQPSWEPLAGAALGAALGLGMVRPFAEWLRLQARMAHVQLQMMEHTASTRESSEVTARRIEDLVALSGEWPVAQEWPGELGDDPEK